MKSCSRGRKTRKAVHAFRQRSRSRHDRTADLRGCSETLRAWPYSRFWFGEELATTEDTEERRFSLCVPRVLRGGELPVCSRFRYGQSENALARFRQRCST